MSPDGDVELFAWFHSRWELKGRAMVEFETCQRPADRAVSKRRDWVLVSSVPERLRAEDAPRPAGTVHDDLRLWARGQCVDAKDQLASGNADRARDAHCLVLLEATGVDDHEVASIGKCPIEIERGDRWRVARRGDQLTKGLAGGVDVAKEFISRLAPCVETSCQDADVEIPKCSQPLACPDVAVVTGGVAHDGGLATRHA